MSEWNGLALQTEYSTELGDVSTSFKALVTNWINDGFFDMAIRHNWPFLRVKGQKLFTASSEEQSLLITSPTAPTVAASGVAGTLDADTYQVAITFLATGLGIETKLGTVSSNVVVAATNQIDVSDIPVSTETGVDRRRVYFRNVTDSGEWLLWEEIADNTTTTSTITANATSVRRPPTWDYLKELDGDPWFESTSTRVISSREISEIWRRESGAIPTGTVSFWAALTKDKILVSPDPSAAITASFYFFKNPARIFADLTHYPQFPLSMKAALDEYVKWRGYRYRERSEATTQFQLYETAISRTISNYGAAAVTVSRVIDVMGDSDGSIVN